MRTEEHFGQFVLNKNKIMCAEEVLGRFFAKST